MKDYDTQQDCMQFVRFEVLKCYKNHKKYDDFNAVVKSVINRRISDFGKRVDIANRMITENRMNKNRDDSFLYSIDNQPEPVYDSSYHEERLQEMIYIVENDDTFTGHDKEVLEVITKIVTEEAKYNIDDMVAYYYGYKTVSDYIKNSNQAEGHESDKDRQRKKFLSRLKSFKTKITSAMKMRRTR